MAKKRTSAPPVAKMPDRYRSGIAWRSSVRRFAAEMIEVDSVQRDMMAAQLLKHVAGYEGDYALHRVSETQLLLAVRDEDKRLRVYDCFISRSGVADEAVAEVGSLTGQEILSRPSKGWL